MANKNDKTPFVDDYSTFFDKEEWWKSTVGLKSDEGQFINLSENDTNITTAPSHSNVLPFSDNIPPSDFKFTKPINAPTKSTMERIKEENTNNKEEVKSTKLKNEIIKYINSKDIEPEYKKYLIKLAERESGFNPNVVNKEGYRGLFQFGDAALTDVGMTSEEYMSDWKKQVDAAIKFTNKNRNMLSLIKRGNIGRKIDNVNINEWGILGAAHLGGVGGVRDYLMYGNNPEDSNRTSIKDYLLYFSV